MRIVIDTNILARGSRGGTGLAAEVMRHISVPPHVLIGSPFLLSELARVLRYPRMRKLHGLDDAEIDAYVHAVQSAALMVDLPPGIPAAVVPKDPDDDPIIATAVAGQAEIICTRDRHFWHPDVQKYCTAHGIRIMTDVELMQLLRAAGP